MGSNYYKELRVEAQRLRAEERLTAGQISTKLRVSKSAVQSWVSRDPLTPEELATFYASRPSPPKPQNPAGPRLRTTATCVVCFTKFERCADRKVTCSRNCRNRIPLTQTGKQKAVRNSAAVCDWRRRLKARAVELKGGKCVVCGYSKCIEALEFHHRDPNEKDFTISRGIKSWARIIPELAKCSLVCSRCHREVHAGVASLPSQDPVVEKIPEQMELAFAAPLESRVYPPDETLARVCRTCPAGISQHSTHCRECANANRVGSGRKISWPSYPELRTMVERTNYCAVGRELGVSDVAVRKMLRRMSK